MKGPRPSKEQIEARTNELLRVMLDGGQKWDFVDFVREREAEPGSPWFVAEGGEPLSYSQIRRYVQRAQRLIAQSGQGEREQLLRMHIAKRDHLYAKAIAQGDTRSALAILDSQAKLQKLVSTDEGKAANGHTIVNIFQRATILAEQFRQHLRRQATSSAIEAFERFDEEFALVGPM